MLKLLALIRVDIYISCSIDNIDVAKEGDENIK